MVPREPRKKGKKQSARMEMPPAAPVISDDEWDSFYRRSVLLLPGVLEAPPVHGDVRGAVEVRERMEIDTTGKFYGNIRTGIFVIHEGGLFEGNCQMEKGSAAKTTEKP